MSAVVVFLAVLYVLSNFGFVGLGSLFVMELLVLSILVYVVLVLHDGYDGWIRNAFLCRYCWEQIGFLKSDTWCGMLLAYGGCAD